METDVKVIEAVWQDQEVLDSLVSTPPGPSALSPGALARQPV